MISVASASVSAVSVALGVVLDGLGDRDGVELLAGGVQRDGVAADGDALAHGQDGVGVHPPVAGVAGHRERQQPRDTSRVHGVDQHALGGQSRLGGVGPVRPAERPTGVVTGAATALDDQHFGVRERYGGHGDAPRPGVCDGGEVDRLGGLGHATDLGLVEPVELPATPRQHLPGAQQRGELRAGGAIREAHEVGQACVPGGRQGSGRPDPIGPKALATQIFPASGSGNWWLWPMA